MKKLIKTIVFLGSLLLLLTSSSCDNDDIETGDHSFSCYINGQLFVPKGSTNLISTSPSNDGLSFKEFNNDLDLVIEVDNSNNKMVIYIKYYTSKNEFSLQNSNGIINYPFNSPETSVVLMFNNKKYISKIGSGTIIFTEASEVNIEGTFGFVLYNVDDENDRIRVTKGKFNA
jgi:hypothetical protein